MERANMEHNIDEVPGNMVPPSQFESAMSEVNGFDSDAAKKARAKAYKETHPDAIEDIEKARVMAEAGDEYRTAAAEKREMAGIYKYKTIDSMRMMKEADKNAYGFDAMADIAESDAAANYDFEKRIPRYKLSENKEQYDQALAELDPGVTREIGSALFTLARLVGPSSPEYEAIVNMINERIFDGEYKEAHLAQGFGDSKIIVGIGE